MRRPAILIAALALALSAAIAAGCGGDDTDASDPTAGLTAPQVLAKARDASRKAPSFEVTIEAAVAGTSRPGATPTALEALVGRPVDVSVKGRARRPHSMSMDAEIAAQALPLNATLIQSGDGLYLDVVGQAFQLVTPKGAVAGIEPANMPVALLDWIAKPKDAGRETIDGARTVHLRGALTRQSLTDLGGLVAVLGGQPAPRGATTATLDKGEIDAWVGTDDLLPRRVRFSLEAVGKLQGLANLSALTVEATLGFSGYGTAEEIPTPSGARKLRLDDLSSLLGG